MHRIPLGDESWVDLVEGFVPDAERQFAELHEAAAWQQMEVLRYDHYIGERRLGAGCAPTTGRCCARSVCTSRRPIAARFTGVAALLYRTGDDFQGLHSDRELRWLDDTRIAIVALGQRRPFVFRRRSRGRRSSSGSPPAPIPTTSS